MLIKGKQIEDYSIPLTKLQGELSQGANQYNGDYNLIPTPTAGNASSTGLSPSQNPNNNTAFYVLVNGIQINLGNASKSTEGFFSIDGGTTAQLIQEIDTNSVFYWNGVTSGYELVDTDRITFVYEIAGAGIGGVDPDTSGEFSTIILDDKRIQYGSAAPTTGEWLRGEIIFNNTTTSNQVVGWICTTSGTPGTWNPFGPILKNNVEYADDDEAIAAGLTAGELYLKTGVGVVAVGTTTNVVYSDETYYVNQDLYTESSFLIGEGPIILQKMVKPATITTVQYRATLDASINWQTFNDLTTYQAWIDSNITTANTRWRRAVVATNISEVGDLPIRLYYTA